jgi:H+/Cl- antiporter ClcA
MMLMVSEMTGSFEALAPAMVAVGIATLIVEHFDDTIYRSQLHRRAERPDDAEQGAPADLAALGS